MRRRGMEDLAKRLLVVLLVLVINRLAVFLPIPGVSPEACAEFFQDASLSGKFIKSLNTFFGGAWEHASVFSIGIQSYITSSILMRFFTISFPYLRNLQNESSAGRQKINQYMR